MEGKSGDSGSAEEAAPPSVAKLAGLFGDKIGAPRKEAPPHKPPRRKPPCSLPLPKLEATNNGDEKVSPSHAQAPKIKVKSSPLIEKLQANLAFAPAALLPGASPKSPGLKVMASPFNSPPSTPSSPGVQLHSSESEESPVSFEQPPEGAPLLSYTKVRTRGSIKRRPPSRRFRKSQTDLDFDIDVTPKENGDKVKEEDAGSGKDKEEPCRTDSAPERDTAAEKSPESAPSDPGKTKKDGDSETQKEETSLEKAEERGHNSITEGALDTSITQTASTDEGAAAGNTEEPGSSDHSELDDKPEK